MRGPHCALILLLLGALCAPARAGDDIADELRDALRDGGVAAAETLLDGVVAGYEGAGNTDRALDAADAAVDVLPWSVGNAHAGRLLLAVLRRERGQPRAWRAAFALRDRLLDGLDVENGIPFLTGMADAYPGVSELTLSLGDLLQGAGRPGAARNVFETVVERAGADDDGAVGALYRLAILDELDGDTAGAIARHAETLRRFPDELWAGCYRARILRQTMRRYDAAERAQGDVLAELDRIPAGPERDRVRAYVDAEAEALAADRAARVDLLAAYGHIDRALLGALAAWLVALLGGGYVLRRKGLV